MGPLQTLGEIELSEYQRQTKPILNIIMRNDLASLNPGKAMAQAAHAGEAMRFKVNNAEGTDWRKLYLEWLSQAGCFGTTLVFEASEREIRQLLGASKRYDVLAGGVVDPTYPVRDGSMTHLLPLMTCAYVFGEERECRFMLGHLNLHP